MQHFMHIVLKRSVPICTGNTATPLGRQKKCCLVKQSLFMKIFVWDNSRGYNVKADKYECMFATCIP